MELKKQSIANKKTVKITFDRFLHSLIKTFINQP